MPMKSKFKKCLLLLLNICFIYMLMASSVFASEVKDTEGDIHIEVTYGYNNYSKYYRQTPVFVSMTNNGPAVSGMIRLTYTGEDQKKSAYAQHFSLASGSSDTVIISAGFIPSYTEMLIEVIDSDDRVIYSNTELTLNYNTNDIFTGILTNHIERTDYLDKIVLYSENYASYYAMRLNDLSALPAIEAPSALKPLDIIFIGSFDVTKLSQEQTDAIKEWVRDGGTLITGPACNYSQLWNAFHVMPQYMESKGTSVSTDFQISGTAYNYLKSPLKNERLHTNPTNDQIINARNTRSSLIVDNQTIYCDPVTVDIYEGDTVSNSDFNLDTMLQHCTYGRGNIISLNFYFDSEEFSSWEGAGAVISEILNRQIRTNNAINLNEYDDYPSYYTIQAMLPNTVSVKSFSLVKYIVLLIIYIIIIGPAAYLLLKKFDKRQWFWVVIPCMSLIFLCVILLVSSETRKDRPFLNQSTIIRYNESDAFEDVNISLTLPEKGNYQLKIPDMYRLRYLYTDSNIYYDYFFDYTFSEEYHHFGPYDIGYAPGNHETDITINNNASFSEWYFNGAKSYATSDNFDISITSDAGKYTIDITNHTENDLDDSGIFIGDRIILTGAIKSGETVHLENADVESYDSAERSSREYESIMKLLNIEDNDQRNGLQNQLFNAIFNERYIESPQRRPVYFAGVKNSYASDALRYTDWEQQGSLVVTKTAQIMYGTKNPEIFIPDISALPCECRETFDYTYFYSDQLEITYQLPKNMAVTSIFADADENITIMVYNYETEAYDAFDLLTDADSEMLTAYTKDHRLKILLNNKNISFDKMTLMPVISLKGEAQQ